MSKKWHHTKLKTSGKTKLPVILKRNKHFVLHYLVGQLLRARQSHLPVKSFPNGRHPYFLFTYYKSFQIINRLKGAALCNIKTRYAIKKRNPE